MIQHQVDTGIPNSTGQGGLQARTLAHQKIRKQGQEQFDAEKAAMREIKGGEPRVPH